MRSGRWERWHTMLMLGVHVTGKRLGNPRHGTDRPGSRPAGAVASTCRSTTTTAGGFPPDQERGATFHADPADLLAVSDILSINCPSSPETVRLLDSERIAMLPEGAIVVNTARGNIVDDEALIAALRSGRLAAAGLDVFDNEPNLHPGYLDLENVFMLPHLGSATRETRDGDGQHLPRQPRRVLRRPPLPPGPDLTRPAPSLNRQEHRRPPCAPPAPLQARARRLPPPGGKRRGRSADR